MKQEMKQEMEKRWLIAVLVVLWVLAAVPGWAGKTTDFTADQVTLDKGGKVLNTAKVYCAGEKMRLEGVGGDPRSKEQIDIIFRRDLKKHFMINQGKKTYFEKDLDEKEMEALIKQNVRNISEKVVGQETVNGHLCTKKEIESEIEIMGMKHKSRSVIWQSPEFIMPLRTQTDNGRMTELRNIRKDTPAASLFEVPKGYRQVSNMMELMVSGSEDEGQEKRQAPEGKGGFKIPKLPSGIKLPFQKQ
jgi:hypothetical protein